MYQEDSIHEVPEQEKQIRRNLYRALRKMGVRKPLITLDADLDRDLHFDPTDRKIFTIFLERIFKLNLDESQMKDIESVKDTIRLLSHEI